MEGNGSQHVVDQTPSLGDRPFFIAVHVGVGHHSAQREKAYKSVMRQACRQAAQELHLSGDPLKAVVAAVSSLEDAPLGNAGVGSNLTVKGVVQCDASTMAGDGAFGAVGAVSGVENPVRVAGELARQSREPMALGRVRPMFLAGDGAREWAKEQGLPAAPSAEAASQWHINGAAQRRWQRYKRMIDEAVQSREAPSNPAGIHKKLPSLQAGEPRISMMDVANPAAKRLRTDISSGAAAQLPACSSSKEDAECLAFDTVGAVCVDALGRVAASVSSGGIAMKTDGRVGEAAMFGCGCWAADSHSGRPAVACSVTGVGEAIMRAGLARACADSLRADAAAAASPDLSAASTVDAVCAQEIRDRIELGQPAGLACPHQDCGVLAVRVSRSAAAIAGGRGGAGGGAGGADGGRAGEPREVPREVHERSHLPGGASGGAGGAGGPGEPWGIQERNCCSAVTAGAMDDGGRSDYGADWSGDAGSDSYSNGPLLPKWASVQCISAGCSEDNAARMLAESLQGPSVGSEREKRDQGTVHVEFGAVHNSTSMGIGYWAHGMEAPVCSILRREGVAAKPAGAGMCFMGAQSSWALDAVES